MSYMTIELTMPPGSSVAGASFNDQGQLLANDGFKFHCFPGAPLSGSLVLHVKPGEDLSLNEKGIKLEFFGLLETSITYTTGSGDDKRTETAYGGGDLFRTTAPIGLGGKFPAGSVTRFPFQFQMPLDARASMETAYASTCSRIAYGIKAIGHISGFFTKNIGTELELIVQPVFAVQTPMTALQPAHDDNSVQVPNICCCACFGTKPLTLSATIPRTVFANGDAFVVDFEIANGLSDPIRQVTIALIHQYDIRTSGIQATAYPEVLQQVTVPTVVLAGQRQSFRQQIVAQGLLPDIASEHLTRTTAVRVHLQAKTMYGATVTFPLSNPCAPGVLPPLSAAVAASAPPPAYSGPMVQQVQAHPILVGASPSAPYQQVEGQ